MSIRDPVLGECPADASEHPVADLELGDAGTDLGHHAGALDAAQLFRPAVHHAADHDLAAVQCRGVELDDHLPLLGPGQRHLARLHPCLAVIAHDPPRFHGGFLH
jgi:hypothetical protein